MRENNVFPDKITRKKILKHYKKINKLLKKDPNAIFFSIYGNEKIPHRKNN